MEPASTQERNLMKDDNSPNHAPAQWAKRGQWTNKRESILALSGTVIGLGNVWRFPYLCFKNGGGVFLIPYFFILFTCGIPLFFLEVSLGQLAGQGGMSCWRHICPLFEGLGYSSGTIMLYNLMYYIVILAWAFRYLFSSFHTVLPWTSCNNTWNTENCTYYDQNHSLPGHVNESATSAVSEFWQRRVLGLSGGIEELGSIRWDLAGCLLLSWIICYFCIWKGVKMTGKVWMEAGSQILFSNFVCVGCLPALGSYNNYNNNCYKDSFALCILNSLTSIVAGLAVFSVLGFMSYELGVDISTVAESGPGLAFIAYPRAVAMMPLPQLWAVSFFIMIIFLGVDSQFVGLEGLMTSISDMYPSFFFTGHRRKLLLLFLCVVSFSIGLLMVTEGGLYVFLLFDYYACTGMPIMCFAILETICVGWIFGADHYYNKIKDMIGYSPSFYMKYCWRFFTPLICVVILLVSLVKFTPLKYDTYQYPWWGYAIGIYLVLSSVLLTPLCFFYRMAVTPGTVMQRLRTLCTPAADLRDASPKKTLDPETPLSNTELCALTE